MEEWKQWKWLHQIHKLPIFQSPENNKYKSWSSGSRLTHSTSGLTHRIYRQLHGEHISINDIYPLLLDFLFYP